MPIISVRDNETQKKTATTKTEKNKWDKSYSKSVRAQ